MSINLMKCSAAFVAALIAYFALMPLIFLYGKLVSFAVLAFYVLYLAYVFKVRKHSFYRGCFYALMILSVYFFSLFVVGEASKVQKAVDDGYYRSVIIHG
ncbi:MAG: hypothetical protein CMF61_00045 [Magnetococcales bacterium]|nr:hypothetical protein [Magnetococcales bacterium]